MAASQKAPGAGVHTTREKARRVRARKARAMESDHGMHPHRVQLLPPTSTAMERPTRRTLQKGLTLVQEFPTQTPHFQSLATLQRSTASMGFQRTRRSSSLDVWSAPDRALPVKSWLRTTRRRRKTRSMPRLSLLSRASTTPTSTLWFVARRDRD